MNLTGIILTNTFAVVLLLIVIENAFHNGLGRFSDNKLYFCLVGLTIVQAIVYTLTYILEDNDYLNSIILAHFINGLIFIINSLFAYLSAVFFCRKLYDVKGKVKINLILLGIPFFITLALCFVNFFTPIFFKINPTNLNYTRTKNYPFFISNIFFYFGIVFVLSHVAKRVNKGYLAYPVLVFLLPIFLALIIESTLTHVSVIMLAVAISLTSVYVNIQNRYFNIDRLSGLSTRNQLTTYLAKCISNRKETSTLVGVMIDIDNFKTINDTYGHIVGDNAIYYMGKVIMESIPSDAIGFRYAGDEFVIILQTKDEKEITEMIHTMKSLFKKYYDDNLCEVLLSFSYGCAKCIKEQDTVESFIKKIDAEMYKFKNKKHNVGK